MWMRVAPEFCGFVLRANWERERERSGVRPSRQHTSKALQQASQYLDAVMRANMRVGQRDGLAGVPPSTVCIYFVAFWSLLLLLSCHLWNGIETVFCFGLLSLSPSHSCSLSLSVSFSTSLLVAFSVSRFSFCGRFSFHFVCAKATDAGSGSMLLSIKLVVGQDVSLPPYSHSGPHFTCPAHWRLCCRRCPSLYPPLIYSSRVKLSSEQTFISVHFYYK